MRAGRYCCIISQQKKYFCLINLPHNGYNFRHNIPDGKDKKLKEPKRKVTDSCPIQMSAFPLFLGKQWRHLFPFLMQYGSFFCNCIGNLLHQIPALASPDNVHEFQGFVATLYSCKCEAGEQRVNLRLPGPFPTMEVTRPPTFQQISGFNCPLCIPWYSRFRLCCSSEEQFGILNTFRRGNTQAS